MSFSSVVLVAYVCSQLSRYDRLPDETLLRDFISSGFLKNSILVIKDLIFLSFSIDIITLLDHE